MTTETALILTGRSETSKFVEWKAKDSQYENIREAVGGGIEMVFTNRGLECYGDEEGLLKQLPQNEAVAYFLEDVKEGLGCRLYYGPFVILFTGKTKDKAIEKAKIWFEKYQNGTLFDSESE